MNMDRNKDSELVTHTVFNQIVINNHNHVGHGNTMVIAVVVYANINRDQFILFHFTSFNQRMT